MLCEQDSWMGLNGVMNNLKCKYWWIVVVWILMLIYEKDLKFWIIE